MSAAGRAIESAGSGAESDIQRLLVLNSGSSSLKWSVLDATSEATLASGASDGGNAGGTDLPPLRELLAEAPPFDGVAHRFVHGGALLVQTVRIDDAIEASLKSLVPLAPLHMQGALAILASCRSWLPEVAEFASFDTAFHRTLPESHRQYALPVEWRERWQLQRFGFHGLSVEYCISKVADLLGVLPKRVLVCHLGSGCSITAVVDGQSFDTTMGFTPMEGPVMSTRSGSIDPGLLLFLLRQGLSIDELEEGLLHRSGLLGLSEISSDLRQIISAKDAGSPQAALAYQSFLLSLTHSLGAMLASLGGVDALVMTGGIGENSAQLRVDLLHAFAFAGLKLDLAANADPKGDTQISAERSAIPIFRIRTREDIAILRGVKAAARAHPSR